MDETLASISVINKEIGKCFFENINLYRCRSCDLQKYQTVSDTACTDIKRFLLTKKELEQMETRDDP